VNRDPKRTAAAVLALAPASEEDRGGDLSEESDSDVPSESEDAALEAAAEEILAAVETKDTRALVGALRSAFRSMRP
jgi:hypothetical protein